MPRKQGFTNVMNRTGLGIFCLLLFCLPLGPAVAQQSRYLFEKEPGRHALVIGNSAYKSLASVSSSATDAEKMAATLRLAGFSVSSATVLTSVRQFEDEVIPKFRSAIEPGDLVVVYYSGHGFSYGPYNFLAPADLALSVKEADLPYAAVSVESVQNYFAKRDPGLMLFLVDACRSLGGFVVSTPKDPNLVPKGVTEAPPETRNTNYMVGFATKPGYPAVGMSGAGQLSPFTKGLLAYIDREGNSFKASFNDVSADVRVETQDAQQPGLMDWSSADFYLKPGAAILAQEKELWLATLETQNRSNIRKFLLRYSVSRYAEAARHWLRDEPEDTVARYTKLSPAAVDRAWEPATGKKAVFPAFSGLAYERSVNKAVSMRLPDHVLGITPSGASALRVDNAKILSDLAGFQALGSAVVTSRLTARASPSLASAAIFDVEPGTKVDLIGAREVEGQSPWLIARLKNSSADIFLRPATLGTSANPVEIGNPLREITVPQRAAGLRDLVEAGAVNDALAEIKAKRQTISWVSVSTSKSSDEREADARISRLSHVEYLLKQAGIDDKRITSLSGSDSFDGPDVRVRFFGF
jgi:hypothetical protein